MTPDLAVALYYGLVAAQITLTFVVIVLAVRNHR
jgi:hypothetical protein